MPESKVMQRPAWRNFGLSLCPCHYIRSSCATQRVFSGRQQREAATKMLPRADVRVPACRLVDGHRSSRLPALQGFSYPPNLLKPDASAACSSSVDLYNSPLSSLLAPRLPGCAWTVESCRIMKPISAKECQDQNADSEVPRKANLLRRDFRQLLSLSALEARAKYLLLPHRLLFSFLDRLILKPNAKPMNSVEQTVCGSY